MYRWPPKFAGGAGLGEAEAELDGGNIGNGDGTSGGGGGGRDGSGNEGSGGDDDELLNLSQAEEIVAAKGLKLPADFVAAAESGGLRSSALNKWVELQNVWLFAFVSRLSTIFRDRLIADDRFLFKV